MLLIVITAFSVRMMILTVAVVTIVAMFNITVAQLSRVRSIGCHQMIKVIKSVEIQDIIDSILYSVGVMGVV